jgi:hypothetical protein
MPIARLRAGMAATLAALCCAMVLLPATGARAEVVPRPPRADPGDASAPVPAPAYRSALARYQRLDEPKPLPWREANDTVARIGGWRVYAREAHEPQAAPAKAP